MTEKLAQLRWHWTLDESNPEAVTVSEYARQVGRSHTVIGYMANGYTKWVASAYATSLADCIAEAQMGPEKIEAAEILGISPVR